VGPSNTTIAYPQLSQVDNTVYENGSTVAVRTHYVYDGLGNVIQEISDGDLAVTGDDRTTVTSYTRLTAHMALMANLTTSAARNWTAREL